VGLRYARRSAASKKWGFRLLIGGNFPGGGVKGQVRLFDERKKKNIRPGGLGWPTPSETEKKLGDGDRKNPSAMGERDKWGYFHLEAGRLLGGFFYFIADGTQGGENWRKVGGTSSSLGEKGKARRSKLNQGLRRPGLS